jgi:uncharacterized protein (TIGR00661 family)
MNLNLKTKTILVAPLNWGLGHATRCIPIIKALEKNNFIPIIATDGIALDLLRKEFPYLQTLELPSYHIEYAENAKNFKWKMIKNCPKMIQAIRDEKKIVKKWIKKYDIDGLISDNRLGVYSKKIPSVFITHQLQVMTGSTTWITSKIHQLIIKKYTQCWVPDFEDSPNLTGELGHLKNSSWPVKYLGPLSRLHEKNIEKMYDLMIILSGPEPQRTMLEEKLKKEILRYKGAVIFIKGIVEKEQKKEQIGHVTYYNYMNTGHLEMSFNQSKTILCRSGYTTVMDLAKLNKKAFFIPTPGQYEQEYLAEKLEKEGLVPYASQDNFKIEDLERVAHYKGLPKSNNCMDWKELFLVFDEN